MKFKQWLEARDSGTKWHDMKIVYHWDTESNWNKVLRRQKMGLWVSPNKDINDSIQLLKTLRIEYCQINIEKIVDNLIKYCHCDNIPRDQIRGGNFKARTRMIILYDFSVLYNALVIGTGNRTELLLGYFTLYGDGACALEPIGHLYKTEVKEIAKYIGVPECIINKIPTAGLWEGQTDEGELGASYEEIDNCLKVWYNECKGEIPNHMVKLVTERIEKNKFKSELPKQLERS